MAQPKRGYRYSVDAFWLAGFALELLATEGLPCGRALDLCTGSGIVAYLLASAGPDVVGIDVQPAWADLWAHSAVERSPVLQIADARTYRGSFDLVTCNPPFFALGTGPVSPDPLRAAAHSELHGTLVALFEAARRLGSVVVFVFPARRVSELPAPDRRVDVGPLALCAWGVAPAPPTQLDRTEAERWVRRFRPA